MSSHIEIEVPDDEDVILVEYFQEQIEGEFRTAMDFGVAKFDDRAQLDDIQVADVVLMDDMIEVTYDVKFSAYYGCRDMDYVDTDERTIRGRCVGNAWVFSRHVSPPPRSTDEEF